MSERLRKIEAFPPAAVHGSSRAEKDDPAALVRDALQRVRDDPSLRVEAEPGGPFTYEDPLLASAWELAQQSERLGFLPAAEGEDLNSRIDHWVPLIIPIVRGRLARNWDVLADRVPDGDIAHTLPMRLAIFGDGGYRGLAQQRVFKMIEARHAVKAFHTIVHLGDTYHGGSENEMLRHLAAPLSALRHTLGITAYSLCGNHDLYAGPDGFLAVLSVFGQPGRYFAFDTPVWRIACLDSSLGDASLRRLGGAIDDGQLEWLVNKQRENQKRLIVVTHHSPRSAFERSSAVLCDQIKAIPGLEAWYWGHEHRSAAYDSTTSTPFAGGCVGHGAFLERWSKKKPKSNAGLNWFPGSARCTCYSSTGRRYWPHGFLELELTAEGISEVWHTENLPPHARNGLKVAAKSD